MLTSAAIGFGQNSFKEVLCDIEPQHRRLLFIASITAVLSILTVNHALLALPMAIVIVMLGTVPFISALLARFFLKERLDWFTILAMVISFAAIVILALGKDENLVLTPSSERNGTKYNTFGYFTGIVFAFLGAVSISVIFTTTRKLQELDSKTIQFWSNFTSVLFFTIMILRDYFRKGIVPFSYQ